MESTNFQILSDQITKLTELIKSGNAKAKTALPFAQRSDSLGELYAALAKAQAEFDIAGLHSANPFFKTKYADLTSIIKATRPALTKNGLCVTQDLVTDENGALHLITEVGHSSGQFKCSFMRINPSKGNDIQSIGSYISYVARYSYGKLLCVATGDEEDDDGEKAMAGIPRDMPKKRAFEPITREQLEQLQYEFREPQYEEVHQRFLIGRQIQSLADLPKSEFNQGLQDIIRVKAAEDKAREVRLNKNKV